MSDPKLKRGLTRTVIGVEVSELEVTMLGGDGVVVANMPLGQFARQGGFDGAIVELRRDFAESWESGSCGSLNMFTGKVGEVQITGTEVVISLKSMIEMLNVQMPRNVYQAGCLHTLYSSPGCNVVAADFTANVSVSSGSTLFTVITDAAEATGYYELGTIECVSGLNVGEKRTVKRYVLDGSEGIFRVAVPWPYIPESGDVYQVKPGCDKKHETCELKFNNLLNFRGFPVIPAPESTL